MRPTSQKLLGLLGAILWSGGQDRPGIERLADRMEKPALDNRSYRVVKLPNELEALLIHDPDTDKASAAMDVHVGSFSDAADMPGMAHAVEHLLFMGTDKYPGENDYNSYLTKYGGHSNAFTASCSTNYFFELSASATSNSPASSANNSKEFLPISTPKSRAPLYGALDRFAQFFVRPLFLNDTLDRELRAVDSENKKNLQSDNWRLNQLNKSLANKTHPFHSFSTGNYRVLHDDPIQRGVKIRDAFIKFYAKHYSANRMKLCVLGRERLDELESWVEELFADVPNQALPQLRWDGQRVYGGDEVGTQVFTKPVMDQRNLDLYFEYPDEDALYESHPSRYISHLIGHEGPGSILAHLKAKGWANSLSAGAGAVCPGTALFTTRIGLTEEGLRRYQDVAKVFFQYVAMLKDGPPQEWIVEEEMKLAEVKFRFKQKGPASSTVSHLSGVMQKPLPRDWLLSGQSLIRRFDAEGITRGLNHLDPANFRLFLISKELPAETNQKEKWYGTEYRYEKIPADLMRELEEAATAPASQRPPELHLPGKNEFVPQRLDVEKKDVAVPAVAPTLVRHDENTRTWFKKDDQFWVPKANIDICLRSPLVNLTPLNAVMTELYKELVEDTLTEYSYDAELAGLNYNIDLHAQGLDISVSGYNDKMPVLLEKVLLSMRDLEVKQDRFDIIKERITRSFKNFEYQEPFRQISTYSRWLVSERGWAQHQLLDELPAVTADDVRAFFPQILRQLHIEILAHGNLHKKDALHVTDLVNATLRPRRLPSSQWPLRRSIVLPPGSDYAYQRQLANPDNINHCIDYNIMVGNNIDRPTRVKVLLLSQILNEPCFDQLRTKEQLGYVVGSSALFFSTVAGFRILIQSEKDCWYLEQRIDAFLTGFEKVLIEMPEEEFEAHKVGLVNKRLEKLKNLSQETGRFWHHITSEVFDFEAVYRDVENIEPLTKDDIIDFHRRYFLPNSPTRAKTSVHLVAQASAEDIAAKTDPHEQLAKLVDVVTQILGQLGLAVDQAALTARLGQVDIASGDTERILGAVSGYLTESAGVAAERAEQVVQQGQAVLAQVLPSLGIVVPPAAPEPNGDGAVDGHAANGVNGVNGRADADTDTARRTVIIEDVKSFKAGMSVSAAARPVKDLREFEEPEPKL